MNSDIDTKKKRKRSSSPSSKSSSRSARRRKQKEKRCKKSRDRSRDRSRNRSRERQKDRSRDRSKDKSKDRSRDRKDKKKKSKKHRSDRKKDKRDRDRSRSRSLSSVDKGGIQANQYDTIPPMDMMMGAPYFYPPQMLPRDRMRPPFYPIQYPPTEMSKHTTMRLPPLNPQQKFEGGMGLPLSDQLPMDKIVKDQNFLNSDEKLYESIITHEMGLRSVFEDVQISEKLAGPYLYRAVKKILHEPNTIIFENDTKKYESSFSMPKALELVNIAIEEFKRPKKLEIQFNNLDLIKEQLILYKERNKQNDTIEQ